MDKGWIKLHRSIMDNWVYQDSYMFHCWIDLLLLANHKQKKMPVFKKLIVIEAGQHLTSYRKLADRWQCNTRTVKKILDTFQSDGMIAYESRYGGTLVSISNYKQYQGFSEPKRNTEYNTEYNKEYNTVGDTEYNAEYNAECIQTRMSKNVKNDIRMNQEIKEPASPIFDSGGFIVED